MIMAYCTSATPALTVTNTSPLVPGTLVTFGGAGLEGQDTAVSSIELNAGVHDVRSLQSTAELHQDLKEGKPYQSQVPY
jgi:hypothetical protein